MTDKKSNPQNIQIVDVNKDRGLPPVSSGTPMPKVKPAASNGTTEPKSESKK